MKYKRQVFWYKDGGCVTLDWAWSKSDDVIEAGFETPNKDCKPIIVIIPGVNNDSNEIYMENFVNLCTSKGYHAVCIGPRG